MQSKLKKLPWVASLLFLALQGCEKKKQPSSEFSSVPAEQRVLLERGKAVYSTACIACHNADPKLDGSLGPAIAGSSLELLRTRVMEAKYPPGYEPKRKTAMMVPLPQFKDDIPAIYEYINFVK